MQIINGKKIQEEILNDVAREVELLNFQPVFTDVLVGEDPASVQYVRMKARMAEKVGMRFHNASFPASISTEELIEEINKLNKVPNMCGIIVQLPLPQSIDKRAVLDAILPRLDVDSLGNEASTNFYAGEINLGFPAALACMHILDSLNLNIKDKKIVVLGQGELVGKPVAALFGFRGVRPIVVNRQTDNKKELLKEADIIISGTGQEKFLIGDMVKEGVIIIDAGTSEDTKWPAKGGQPGIVGDVDLGSMEKIASYVSPVPGGVGPVTVAMLLQNVLKVAKNIKN